MGIASLSGVAAARWPLDQCNQSGVAHAMPVIRISLEAAYHAFGLGKKTARPSGYTGAGVLPLVASPYPGNGIYYLYYLAHMWRHIMMARDDRRAEDHVVSTWEAQ